MTHTFHCETCESTEYRAVDSPHFLDDTENPINYCHCGEIMSVQYGVYPSIPWEERALSVIEMKEGGGVNHAGVESCGRQV